MGQLFQTNGEIIPVTYITVQTNIVSQVKTVAKDGYNAIQVVADSTSKPASKSLTNHLAKINFTKRAYLREIRTDQTYQLNDKLTINLFKPGDMIDVIAISKGKGTAGVIKRHNFSRGPMSHGSKHHRAPGSVGLSRPDKIWKGQPLPGRMGNQQITVRNLQIVNCLSDKNIIIVKGSIPGIRSTLVKIRNAKQPSKQSKPIQLFNNSQSKENK